MKPEKILTSNFLDILFENRNKQYGAYELRKNYNNRLKKSLLFMILVVAVFSLTQSFKVPKKTGTFEVDNTIKLTTFEIPKDVPKTPQTEEPKRNIQEKNISTAAVAAPIVVPDKLANKNMSDVDKIDSSLIGTTEKTGGKFSEIVNASEAPPSDGKGTQTEVKQPIVNEEKEPEILNFSEIMPEFPGGKQALINFLQKNLRQPNDFEEGEKITVIASFVVNTQGEIDAINIVQHGRDDLDKEVVRVMKKMPTWKPGIQNGRNVNVFYKVPVTFVAPE